MPKSLKTDIVRLDLTQPLWSHVFLVTPLTVIGSKELDGGYDLAPKNMVTPLGWDNYFGFVCTPNHRTYQNIQRERAFTVSFPQPQQVVLTSLAAAPRCEDQSKPALTALQTFPASIIDGIFLKDAYLFLECELDRIVDGFGENSLIAGKIIAASVQGEALRVSDQDDSDLLARSPLLAYLSPGRYAKVDHSFSFPFHTGFKR